MKTTVCWQDTDLVFGPLNDVYQTLSLYSDIIELWNNIPSNNYVWLSTPGESALIIHSDISHPYDGCYSLSVERGFLGYPKEIKLGIH